MFNLFLRILLNEDGVALSMTRKTANTLITAAGMNLNMTEIEAVINALTAANLANDSVGMAALASDVIRADYGLIQHTDGSLYVDLSDTTPGLELTDGGLRAKVYGLASRTANGIDIGRSGDLLLSSSGTTPDGWTDVSATYEGKFIKISATALSSGTASATGTSDSHTLTTAEMPAHTHTISNKMENLNSGGAGPNLANAGAFSVTTDSTGGGGGHTHGITLTSVTPAYVSTKMYQKT